MGTFQEKTTLHSSSPQVFNVTTLNQVNLVGRSGIADLDVRHLMKEPQDNNGTEARTNEGDKEPRVWLEHASHKLCEVFPDLFKPELGCLKDFELEVKFKTDAKPVFCKLHMVPYSMLEDLTHTYEDGIKKGIWIPMQFNDYGTPVGSCMQGSTARPEKGQTSGVWRLLSHGQCTIGDSPSSHATPR